MSYPTYSSLSISELKEFLNLDSLALLVTATEIETRETHSSLEPINGQSKLIQINEKGLTFYIGKFGIYNIVHVQCSMGSIGRSGSIMTVTAALDVFQPKLVVMVGIAFGVDENSQNIGDVLISESICPYDSRRVGENATVQRAIEARASKLLLSRFKSITLTWQHLIEEGGSNAKLIFTRLLSGEQLIDNIQYRNELVASFPDSKGGEMEGAGVATACDSRADWILVKGICDFADGKKGHNKDERQLIAARSALSACREVFSNQYSFQELGLHPILANENGEPSERNSDVLFEVYDSSKEGYYIVRTEDGTFTRTLDQFGVWVWGPPGSGKSSSITRNLFYKQHKFVQVTLASCETIEECFSQIIFELQDFFALQIEEPVPLGIQAKTRLLKSILKKGAARKDLVIVLDEIPISETLSDVEFSEKLFSLIIELGTTPELSKIKIVLSSLHDPRPHLKRHRQKILSLVSFLQFKFWPSDQIDTLIKKIESEIKLSLGSAIKKDLISKSGGSPRFIKKFYKSCLAQNTLTEETLRQILSDVENELKTFCNA